MRGMSWEETGFCCSSKGRINSITVWEPRPSRRNRRYPLDAGTVLGMKTRCSHSQPIELDVHLFLRLVVVRVSSYQGSKLLGRSLVLESIAVAVDELSRVVVDHTKQPPSVSFEKH